MVSFRGFINELAASEEKYALTAMELLDMLPKTMKSKFKFLKKFDKNFFGNLEINSSRAYKAKLSLANFNKIPEDLDKFSKDSSKCSFEINNQKFIFYVSKKTALGNSTEGKISFTGGDNTKIGETIQICGLLSNKLSLAELEKKLTSIEDLSDPVGVKDKYLSNKGLYEPALLTIMDASQKAYKNIVSTTGIKYNKTIHNSISEFYSISSKIGLTDKNISKANTADCILYTGSDFLSNLGDKGNYIDYSDYNIKIIEGGKEGRVLNNFVQISLKNSGRVGDSSSMTTLSNSYKYEYYNESFADFVKSISQKTSRMFINIKRKMITYISSITDRFISFFNNEKIFKDKAIALFGVNEAKQKLPDEQMIGDKYSNKDEFDKLSKKAFNSLKAIENKLSSMGNMVIYKIDNIKSIKYTSDYKELRFIYFNVVSLMILEDYILNLDEVSEFRGMEIEMVYGNTIMPLIKVFGDPENYIEWLPIIKDKRETNYLPLFGLLINKNKDHFSFYMNFLSSIGDTPSYLNVQMRTKGNQYVVDGQSYVSIEKTLKKFK